MIGGSLADAWEGSSTVLQTMRAVEEPMIGRVSLLDAEPALWVVFSEFGDMASVAAVEARGFRVVKGGELDFHNGIAKLHGGGERAVGVSGEDELIEPL